MNGYADYIDLPNGKRMELSASIPDIEEVPGPLSDEEKALIEMLENEFETFLRHRNRDHSQRCTGRS